MDQAEVAALENFLDPAIFELLFPVNDSSTATEVRQATGCSEFKRSNEGDLKYLADLNTNSNTANSTKTWLRRFSKWATERGVQTDIKLIPKAELDAILQHFYAELMKTNGEEYEPESLKVMVAALDRYLRENCAFSILKDKEFAKSRKVLNGKAIDLQNKGKGKRPNRADFITAEEEELLWSSILGLDTPTSLNYTTFFLLGQHFGTRGRQEHHQMRIEEFKLTREPKSGKLIQVEWMEGPTKTRKGGLNKRPRTVTQKIFRTDGPKCPISCYSLSGPLISVIMAHSTFAHSRRKEIGANLQYGFHV